MRYQYLALFYTRCAFFTLKWMPIPIIVIWTIALNITNWRAIFHYCFLLISTGCSTATTCSIFILFGIVCAWTARRALCVISWRLAFFAHKVACRTKIAAKSRNWWRKLSCRTTQSTHQATCRKTLKKNAKKYIVSVNAKWGTPILPSFRSEVGYPASRGHIFQVWSARRAKKSLWRQLKPRKCSLRSQGRHRYTWATSLRVKPIGGGKGKCCIKKETGSSLKGMELLQLNAL